MGLLFIYKTKKKHNESANFLFFLLKPKTPKNCCLEHLTVSQDSFFKKREMKMLFFSSIDMMELLKEENCCEKCFLFFLPFKEDFTIKGNNNVCIIFFFFWHPIIRPKRKKIEF